MRIFYPLCVLLLVTVLPGCMPSVPRDDARSVAAVSAALLAHPEGDIPESSWPDAVRSLKPERVYRNHQGVYICTYEFFVEQRGIFILDPASLFIPRGTGDPSYDAVTANVFIYRSAG
jgi:hypothetical protein